MMTFSSIVPNESFEMAIESCPLMLNCWSLVSLWFIGRPHDTNFGYSNSHHKVSFREHASSTNIFNRGRTHQTQHHNCNCRSALHIIDNTTPHYHLSWRAQPPCRFFSFWKDNVGAKFTSEMTPGMGRWCYHCGYPQGRDLFVRRA